PSIRIVRNAVPEEVEEAIFGALGKVPADRPQTAGQFAEIMGLMPGHTSSMRARTSARRTQIGTPSRGTQTYDLPAQPLAWWRHPLAIASGVAIVVALVGAFTIWRAPGRRTAAALSPDGRRIAVLYFDDKSDNHSLGPVADGLTEELIHSLST